MCRWNVNLDYRVWLNNTQEILPKESVVQRCDMQANGGVGQEFCVAMNIRE